MLNTFSGIQKTFATAAVALLGYGAFGMDEAQAYSMGGRGGSSGDSYGYIELDYPQGQSRRVLTPYTSRDSMTDAEKQDYRAIITPVLKDYTANILPQLSQTQQSAFAFVVTSQAYDAGVDVETFCHDIGYDYALVEAFELEGKVKSFGWKLENLQLDNAAKDSGYRLFPAALYRGEGDVDDFNALLTELQAVFPNEPYYQDIAPFTYDVLHEMRAQLGRDVAGLLLRLHDEITSGRVNMDYLDHDKQEFLSLAALMLTEPDTLDERDSFETEAYNARMPEHIDNALASRYAMPASERRDFYSQIFRIRDYYDLRPLQNEERFLAGDQVIGAPSP